MKNLILITLIIFPSLVFSQSIQQKIISEKINGLYVDYVQSVDVDKGDTLIYFWLGFRNQKYQTIVDIQSVMMSSKSEFSLFMKDLISVYKTITAGQKQTINWDRSPSYILRVSSELPKYGFLYETTSGTDAYTLLDKRVLSSLLEIMSQIDFGSTALKQQKSIEELTAQ